MPQPHAVPRPRSHAARLPAAGDNARYQRRLAESLMSTMEPDEAIHWCHTNGWEGVLRILLALQSGERSHPPSA